VQHGRRARLDRSAQLDVVGQCGQDDAGHARLLAADIGERVDAALPGKIEIDHRHVRAGLADLLERLTAAFHVSDHAQVGGRAHDRRERLPVTRVVLDEHDGDHGIMARTAPG
jgi:hypothetical protein